MKTILATTWNALIDRLRRDQVLGCTVLHRGGWKHPWQVTPAWDPKRERWTVEIHPGFVNGLDAEVRMDGGDAPLETLERLGLDARNAHGKRVDAWLTEGPQIPLRQWRAIGADAAPDKRVGVGDGNDRGSIRAGAGVLSGARSRASGRRRPPATRHRDRAAPGPDHHRHRLDFRRGRGRLLCAVQRHLPHAAGSTGTRLPSHHGPIRAAAPARCPGAASRELGGRVL